MQIQISDIYEDQSFNSRGKFTQRSVEELAELLNKYGQIYPVDVQPAADCTVPSEYQYRLLAGYRRMAAARLLGWTEITATVREGLTEEEAAVFNFLENSARQQLSPVEEARWIERTFPGRRPREIAKAVGKSLRWVLLRQKVTRMPPMVQSALAIGKLPLTEIERLATYDTEEQIVRAFEHYMRRTQDNRVTKKQKPPRQSKKSKAEMIAMADRLIREGLQGLGSKALIWAAGCIEDGDLEAEIKNAKEAKGAADFVCSRP